MTGQTLQTIKPTPGVVLGIDEQKWNQMIREANVLAATKMVPKAMQGEPGVVLAAMAICEAYGADRRLAIAQVHYMNNELVPSAQLRIGVACARGYEVSWEPRDGGLLSRRKAILAIRRPGRKWQRFSSAHEDQVEAGKFDEWVEVWSDAEHQKLKWIVRRDGQPYPHDTPAPQWAVSKIAAGAMKKFDGWWNFEEDMHACSASRKAIRRYAPDALLGVDSLAVSAAGDIETGEIFDDEDDADEIVPQPLGDDAAPAPYASETAKRRLLAVIAALDPWHRDTLKEAMWDDPDLPPIKDGRFTVVHLARALELIDETWAEPEPAKTEATVRGSAVAEEVGGGAGPEPQAGQPAPPTYAPGEEPVE